MRLRQNPQLLYEYDAIIQDQLRRRIIERVDQTEAASDRTY